MNVIPTVGVLIFRDKKVLLVKHGEKAKHINGVYGWPGGRLKKGETIKQAALRELKEETGLETKADDLDEFMHDIQPAEIERKNGKIQFFSVKLFVCEKFSGDLVSSDETIPEWVPVSEIDNYPLLPNVKRVVSILSQVV